MPMSWLHPIARAWTTENVHASPQPRGAPGPHLNSMPSVVWPTRRARPSAAGCRGHSWSLGILRVPQQAYPPQHCLTILVLPLKAHYLEGLPVLTARAQEDTESQDWITESCLLPAGLLLGQGQPCWEGPRSWRPEEGRATLGWMSPPHDAPGDPCPPGTDGQARLSYLVQASLPLQQKPKSPYCVQGHLGCAWPARTSLGLGSICPCFSGARAAVRKSRDPCP